MGVLYEMSHTIFEQLYADSDENFYDEFYLPIKKQKYTDEII